MDQHKPDVISLVFGGLFVALAVVLPLEAFFDSDLSLWVVPAAVLLLGVGIAVSAVASARNQD